MMIENKTLLALAVGWIIGFGGLALGLGWAAPILGSIATLIILNA